MFKESLKESLNKSFDKSLISPLPSPSPSCLTIKAKTRTKGEIRELREHSFGGSGVRAMSCRGLLF